ncbi:Uncharacterised protein [Mycobacteroides abscessus subsp. abscessus]|nr:Uncharacterised protein [Mycobacteroides abscessus subsp. abscessus]
MVEIANARTGTEVMHDLVPDIRFARLIEKTEIVQENIHRNSVSHHVIDFEGEPGDIAATVDINRNHKRIRFRLPHQPQGCVGKVAAYSGCNLSER